MVRFNDCLTSKQFYRLFDKPKTSRDVVILQHSTVIVEQRRIASRHNVKVVRRTRVLVIVYDRCHQDRKNF